MFDLPDDDFEAPYHCKDCSQSWTEGELEETGSLGELLWECPGCLAMNRVPSSGA